MKRRVFISYTSKDENAAAKLQMLFRRLGAEVWYDANELAPGDSVEGILERAIEHETDILAVCLSAKSVLAPWVKWEEDKAHRLAESGGHQEVLYVLIDDFHIPEEIKKAKYIDFHTPSELTREAQLRRQLQATEEVAKYLASHRILRRYGLYDVYLSYSDMDARRERSDGLAGCNLDQFLASASKSVIAIGLHFGNLLGGASYGGGLAQLLKNADSPSELSVDLFVPHPEKTALQNLRKTHFYGKVVQKRIQAFCDDFRQWGRNWELTEEQASRCKLHLLSTVPTHSLLGIDAEESYGRLIIDVFVYSIDPRYQPKLELRHPRTPLYQVYLKSFGKMREKEVVETLQTTHI